MENELQGFYLERKILEDNKKDSGELKENEKLDFSFLQEIYILDNKYSLLINEDFEVDLYDFLHGYCKFFSTCLHDKFGYEIINIYDNNDYSLIHSFCIDEEGNFIDIRGKTTNEEFFFSEFDDWISYYEWQENPTDNRPQDLEAEIDREIYNICELIINQYIEFYK